MMSGWRVPICCVLLGLGLATGASAGEKDARYWLDRMGESLASVNYEGTFVHIHGGSSETLKVVRRVGEDGRITERLVSLDGAGREIIRKDDEVTCIFGDQRSVLKERRDEGNGQFFATVPVYSEKLDLYYSFLTRGESRMLDRQVREVAVVARDRYRFGYRLWLDHDTAIPLKSQLVTADGKVVEEVKFADIRFPLSIPEASTEPSISYEGFKIYYTEPSRVEAEQLSAWRADRVPGGFELSSSSIKTLTDSETPVEHLVYSDGLASVSVFVEAGTGEAAHGFSTVGAANAYSTAVDDHQVTAVGEVPRPTVEMIARSVTRETLEASR